MRPQSIDRGLCNASSTVLVLENLGEHIGAHMEQVHQRAEGDVRSLSILAASSFTTRKDFTAGAFRHSRCQHGLVAHVELAPWHKCEGITVLLFDSDDGDREGLPNAGRRIPLSCEIALGTA